MFKKNDIIKMSLLFALDILEYAKAATKLLTTKNSLGFFQGNLKNEMQKEICLLTLLQDFHVGKKSIKNVKEELISLIEAKQKNSVLQQKK